MAVLAKVKKRSCVVKKLIVYGLVVALVCSYVIPVEAMLSQEGKEELDSSWIAGWRKAAAERRMAAKVAKEKKVSTAVSMPVEQPQAGLVSRGWQATQQGVSAAGQRVSGGLSYLKGGVQRGVASTQQAIRGTLEAVRSLSWEQTIQVLTLIAGMFGLVILVYNNSGQLIDTISSGASSFANSPLTGLAGVGAVSLAANPAIDYQNKFPYYVEHFRSMSGINEYPKDLKGAIIRLKDHYQTEYIRKNQSTWIIKKAYDKVMQDLELLKQKN